jgi:Na+/H+ antiporter NhaD/arsenite permease-like protein
MTGIVAGVFVCVYVGMMLGRFPGLALDRTGIVLVGLIVLVLSGAVTLDEAWEAVDVPTIALLFGLMVLSAQFRLGGFYSWVTRRIAGSDASPAKFLLLVILASGALSALLANDIICLAMTPVLLEACQRRHLRPLPFLLALACSSNIGSAATLIGNPQNMLIGQVLGLGFGTYFLQAIVPATVGLFLCWGIILFLTRGSWVQEMHLADAEIPPFNGWQTGKGVAVLVALVAVFVFEPIPREVAALGAGGLLLASRRLASRQFLALIDWNLLLLFIGLFVVNGALADSGLLASAVEAIRGWGVDPNHGGALFVVTAVLSNLVSNVPAVMLLLGVTEHPQAGLILAMSSTLAGNLILVGSIANLIVVEQAWRLGLKVSFIDHVKVGVPVTLATLGFSGLWIWGLVAWMG